MPLLDSFKVDHTKMNAPAVRVAKTMRTPKGDDITIFDLRFCIPNKEILPEKGRISLLGMQKRRSNTVMVSPLGVVMVLATRTAGACIRVWSTLKLSSRGICVSFEVNRFLARDI